MPSSERNGIFFTVLLIYYVYILSGRDIRKTQSIFAFPIVLIDENKKETSSVSVIVNFISLISMNNFEEKDIRKTVAFILHMITTYEDDWKKNDEKTHI